MRLYLLTIIVPLLLIVLSIPIILGLVPRNHLYTTQSQRGTNGKAGASTVRCPLGDRDQESQESRTP